jgi:hypothetical protein
MLYVFSLGLSGCGGDDSGASNAAGGGTTQTSPATTGTFQLSNQTGLPISLAYIATDSASSWGDNLLSTPLADGASQSFSGYAPGVYDGQAVIAGAFSIYFGYAFNMTLSAGQTYSITSTPSAYSGSIKVNNNSSTRTILGVYISPTTSTTWGPNQISSSIAPGGSTHFYDVIPQNYDIKIIWNSGSDSTYPSVNVSYLTLTTQGAL